MTLLFSFICTYLIIGIFVANYLFTEVKEDRRWKELERATDPGGLKFVALMLVFGWPIVLTMLTVLWYKDR